MAAPNRSSGYEHTEVELSFFPFVRSAPIRVALFMFVEQYAQSAVYEYVVIYFQTINARFILNYPIL